MGGKLNGKPVGKSSLSRRGWTCDHNKFPGPVIRDPVCDLRDLGLLESLCDKDQFIGSLFADLFIQVSNCICSYHLPPACRFFLDLKKFCPGFKRRY